MCMSLAVCMMVGISEMMVIRRRQPAVPVMMVPISPPSLDSVRGIVVVVGDTSRQVNNIPVKQFITLHTCTCTYGHEPY